MTPLGSFVTISLQSGVASLMLVIRMSSEVCQLCLEAVTPLAEQCAKAQETDSALFLATRHFLKVRQMFHGMLWAFGCCVVVGFLYFFCIQVVSGGQIDILSDYINKHHAQIVRDRTCS